MGETNVSIGKIEELKKRAKVSYKEAKQILEKHNGDIVEALIELEQKKKTFERTRSDESNKSKESEGFTLKLKKLFIKGNRTKLLITKEKETIANIPVNYAIIFLVFAFHLSLFTLLLVFVTGCKTAIKKAEGDILDIDDVIINLSADEDDIDNTAGNTGENRNGSDNTDESGDSRKVNLQKDGYNEYTVG